MRDIPDQLDGIVNDLFCVVYTLELYMFLLVNQVFTQVKPGCSEKWSCIIMKVCCNALPFFFLPAGGLLDCWTLLLTTALAPRLGKGTGRSSLKSFNCTFY
jgi:hypothetical protein